MTGPRPGPRPWRRNTPEKFWEKSSPCPITGCWWWTGAPIGGEFGGDYGQVTINGVRWVAHRLAFALTHGCGPTVVMHTCDQPACVNPTHLKTGTDADNSADCLAKGREARGERIGSAKLTRDCVTAIRAVYASGGANQPTLARWFGVDDSTISRIVRREYWSHV